MDGNQDYAFKGFVKDSEALPGRCSRIRLTQRFQE